MRTHPAPLPATEEPVTGTVMPRLRALGFRFLHVIDSLTLFAMMHLITVARFGLDWPTFPYSHYLVGFSLATVIHVVVYYFGGMYEYEQRLGNPPWLPKATLLTGIAILSSAAMALATGRYLMPRGNLLVLFFVASGLVTFNRWFARRVRSRRFGAPKVLLVGSPDDIELARRHLGDAGSDATVVGSVPTTVGLLDAVDGSDATDVLLLGNDSLDEIYPSPIDRFEHRLIGVYRRVQPVDTLLGLQRSRQIAGMPFVALRTHAVPLYRLRLKRILDLVLLVVALPIIVLVVGLAALYAFSRAGRGIIYRQERVGRGGASFEVLKFRTMIRDAEAATGATLATEDDPRVLKGMRWFRAARLDELPQLWNVAKGEMSLVGPRPERAEFVDRFEELLPGYSRRHDMPPGVTGLAQIRGHYQTDPGYKLGHDLQYIVNWSPVLDLMIMLETVVVMARRSAR
ncbi:MAG: sugar transferase [Actinomycetota bacterium]